MLGNTHILTGHIGSGKSSVAKVLMKMGYYVVNIDRMTKDIVLDTPEIKAALFARFGSGAVVPEIGLSEEVRELALKDMKVYDWIDGMLSVYLSETLSRVNKFLFRTAKPETFQMLVESATVPQWLNERARGKVFRILVTDTDARIDRVVERHKSKYNIETECRGFYCRTQDEYDANKRYLADYRNMIVKTDELQNKLDDKFFMFSNGRPTIDFTNDKQGDPEAIAKKIVANITDKETTK